MGTAEIYRAVLALDEITDALVVDVAEGEERWMPLFVVLREGAELDDDLVAAIRQARARGLLAAPRPERGVPRSPRSRARCRARCSRCPVKRILMGTPPEKAASRDSLANPEALDWFVELAAKRGR